MKCKMGAYLCGLLFGVLGARCLLLLGLLLLFLLLGRWAKVFAGYLLVLGLLFVRRKDDKTVHTNYMFFVRCDVNEIQFNDFRRRNNGQHKRLPYQGGK